MIVCLDQQGFRNIANDAGASLRLREKRARWTLLEFGSDDWPLMPEVCLQARLHKHNIVASLCELERWAALYRVSLEDVPLQRDLYKLQMLLHA